MPIQVLSEIVAAQIAAGEVVERPASVVKELVDNSLDAGASHIQIECESGGRKLIRVTDNGSGIAGEEAELAFVRHATSKLQSVEDLYHLQTLGFRGEALASISSVSLMTLITRTATESAGTHIRMRGGVLIERRSTGTPVGTTISVENLFFNTPARLKFLKTESSERRAIDQMVSKMAIAYPNVRFSLRQDGRVVFQSTGNGSLSDVLIEVLGVEVMREMLEIIPAVHHRPDLPNTIVHGFTSAPHLNRSTRANIQLFVNGRAIQDSSLSYAVVQAYHTLMPGDRFPIAAILITLPPEDVDVNVHPTKAEVRFRLPDNVFSAVQHAVRNTVLHHSPIPTLASPSSNSEPDDDDDLNDPEPSKVTPPFTASPESVPRQIGFGGSIREAGRRTQQIPEDERQAYSEPPLANSLRNAPTPPPRPLTTPPPYAGTPGVGSGQVRKLPPMRVVGQIAATYIIAEGPAGMYLIDQHAAHERILYEQYMEAQAGKDRMSQQTLDLITIEVSPESARLLRDHSAGLAKLGFDLTITGRTSVRVSAVPTLLANHSPADSLQIILGDLESGAEPGAATLEAKVTLRVCKAVAVKAGQTLSYQEMQGILRQLELCQVPRTCPHGRPTLIHLSSDQLAKEFGRT
jgi:DNA mismatch repair protein MutL